MQNNKQFEIMIKSALNENTRDILPSDEIFDKIKIGIESDRSEINLLRGSFFKPYFRIKKAIAVGLCFTFLFAGSVFAADYISKYVKGFITEKEYATTPTKAEINKDAGFAVKIPETLPGGFKLENTSLAGYIDGSSEIKKDGNRKVIGAIYKSPESNAGSYLTLSVSNDETETLVGKGAETVYINGAAAYYWEYILHVVPSDYEPSDKEIEQEKSGEIVTVYTSVKNEKIAEQSTTVRALKWKDSEINYILSDNNCNLSLDELLKMAESIINTK